MDRYKVKALQRITDGGHNLQPGDIATVNIAYADEWCRLGWAERVADAKPRK